KMSQKNFGGLGGFGAGFADRGSAAGIGGGTPRGAPAQDPSGVAPAGDRAEGQGDRQAAANDREKVLRRGGLTCASCGEEVKPWEKPQRRFLGLHTDTRVFCEPCLSGYPRKPQ